MDASGGSGSTTVTVPAAANLVVAMSSWWDFTAEDITQLSINSVNFTIRSNIDVAGDECGCLIATLNSPATGSQTFAWTQQGAGGLSEGGWIALTYVADANLSDPVRASAVDVGIDAGNVSVTIASETTDLMLAFGQSYTTVGSITVDGTEYIDNQTINSEIFSCTEVTPGSGTTAVNMTNERYSALGAITLKVAGGAASLPPGLLGGAGSRLRGLGGQIIRRVMGGIRLPTPAEVGRFGRRAA